MSQLDRYTCEETFNLLNDYVDRELNEDQIIKVREHLAVCEECAGEFAFEAQVILSVRAKISQINCPVTLRDRVLQALLKAQTD